MGLLTVGNGNKSDGEGMWQRWLSITVYVWLYQENGRLCLLLLVVSRLIAHFLLCEGKQLDTSSGSRITILHWSITYASLCHHLLKTLEDNLPTLL